MIQRRRKWVFIVTVGFLIIMYLALNKFITICSKNEIHGELGVSTEFSQTLMNKLNKPNTYAIEKTRLDLLWPMELVVSNSGVISQLFPQAKGPNL
jgi:hypothetical protein